MVISDDELYTTLVERFDIYDIVEALDLNIREILDSEIFNAKREQLVELIQD